MSANDVDQSWCQRCTTSRVARTTCSICSLKICRICDESNNINNGDGLCFVCKNRIEKQKDEPPHKKNKLKHHYNAEKDKKEAEKNATKAMSAFGLKETDVPDNVSFITDGVDLASALSTSLGLTQTILLNMVLKCAFQYVQDLINSGAQSTMEVSVLTKLLKNLPETQNESTKTAQSNKPTKTAQILENLLMLITPECFQYELDQATAVKLFSTLLRNSDEFQIKANKVEKQRLCDLFTHFLSGSNLVSSGGRGKMSAVIAARWRRLGTKIRKPVMEKYKGIKIAPKKDGQTGFEYIVNAQNELWKVSETIKCTGTGTKLDKMLCERRRRRFVQTTYLQLYHELNE